MKVLDKGPYLTDDEWLLLLAASWQLSPPALSVWFAQVFLSLAPLISREKQPALDE